MNHLELFSGIGGFRRAMDLLSIDGIMNLRTVAYSEIDKNAATTYCANYDTQNELAIGDIVSFVGNEDNYARLPQFDILTAGFPCQTFSMMGNQLGFAEDRGQMFFRILDILQHCHPRFILLENVKNLITHDKGNTFKVIKFKLQEAGYTVHHDIFNTLDFGLPQKRNRTIIFGRLNQFGDFNFSNELVKEHFLHIEKDNCSLNFYDDVIDLLSRKVDEKYYLSEKIKPTLLSDGSASFRSNSDIDQIIARPLTATMHKMHRACQDNYYSDIFIKTKGKRRPSETLSKEELALIPIRKLTPQEAFLLQGFPRDFAKKAEKAKVSNGAMYKQAGNAVSVNTIYAVLHYLISNNIMFN